MYLIQINLSCDNNYNMKILTLVLISTALSIHLNMDRSKMMFLRNSLGLQLASNYRDEGDHEEFIKDDQKLIENDIIEKQTPETKSNPQNELPTTETHNKNNQNLYLLSIMGIVAIILVFVSIYFYKTKHFVFNLKFN